MSVNSSHIKCSSPRDTCTGLCPLSWGCIDWQLAAGKIRRGSSSWDGAGPSLLGEALEACAIDIFPRNRHPQTLSSLLVTISVCWCKIATVSNATRQDWLWVRRSAEVCWRQCPERDCLTALSSSIRSLTPWKPRWLPEKLSSPTWCEWGGSWVFAHPSYD